MSGISKVILGSLMVSPQLLTTTDELTDELFSDTREKAVFQFITTEWENHKPEMIDPTRVVGILNFDGAVSYVSSLTDGLYSVKPEVFADHVAMLVKENLTRKIYANITNQANTGVLDLSEIKPLLQRYEIIGDKTKKIAESVRGWVETSSGEFDLRQIYREIGAYSVKEQANVRQTLLRMAREGIVSHSKKQYGRYRKVEKDCTPIDFVQTEGLQPLEITLPMNLNAWVNIYPGNIIVVAGEWEAGKTAWMLNVVKENLALHEIHYFSSEMGASELNRRLARHEDMKMEEWLFYAHERSHNFAEVIVPDKINIIDYLEVSDSFWLVAKDLADIHEKLGKGVAFVALQKGTGQEKGRGGDFSLEKPRLYITLSKVYDETDGKHGVAKILKAKNWAGNDNPNGRILPFKLVQGAKFVHSGTWAYPESYEELRNSRNSRACRM